MECAQSVAREVWEKKVRGRAERRERKESNSQRASPQTDVFTRKEKNEKRVRELDLFRDSKRVCLRCQRVEILKNDCSLRRTSSETSWNASREGRFRSACLLPDSSFHWRARRRGNGFAPISPRCSLNALARGVNCRKRFCPTCLHSRNATRSTWRARAGERKGERRTFFAKKESGSRVFFLFQQLSLSFFLLLFSLLHHVQGFFSLSLSLFSFAFSFIDKSNKMLGKYKNDTATAPMAERLRRSTRIRALSKEMSK